jgi:hypothetical protein
MGVHSKVGFKRFPKQGDMLGREVRVCFNYDTSRTIPGKVVRNDHEDPHLMLIQLEDGRIVRDVECQYTFKD